MRPPFIARTLAVGIAVVAVVAAVAWWSWPRDEPVAWNIVGTTNQGASLLVSPARYPRECERYRAEVVRESADTVELQVLERSQDCRGDSVGQLPPILTVSLEQPLHGRRVSGTDLERPLTAPQDTGGGMPPVLEYLDGIPDSRGLSRRQATELWFRFGIRPTISGPDRQAVVVQQSPPAGATLQPGGRTRVALRTAPR